MAEALAAVLAGGDVIVLTGDLGAGKTCFTQGLGRGLGVEDRITSQTFTLANRYDGRLRLNHLDVYRLESVAESIDLGLDELVEDGVTVIEWGDRIEQVLPVQHLLVRLHYPEPSADLDPADLDDVVLDQRLIDIVIPAGGPWTQRDLGDLLGEWRDR